MLFELEGAGKNQVVLGRGDLMILAFHVPSLARK